MKEKKLTVGAVCISILLLITIVILFITSPEHTKTTEQTATQMIFVPDRSYIPTNEDVPDIVWNAATTHINSEIQDYPNFERDYGNWRIEALTQVYIYEDFNGMALCVYRLNFEFLAKDPEKIELVGGMTIDEEGWVIPNYANSTYLIFRQDGTELSYLTTMFENDCVPGDEVFDHDLSIRLESSS